MNTKKMSYCVTIAVLVILCLSQTAVCASSLDDLVAEEKQHVVAKQNYTLNLAQPRASPLAATKKFVL